MSTLQAEVLKGTELASAELAPSNQKPK
jgi:hypothetical protein